MKKICLLAIGITSVIFSFSQTPAKFFIKGGINVSSLSSDNDADDNEIDSKIGLHAGIGTHIHLAPQWALQPELLYSQEGAEIGAKVKLDYLNLPVMVQYMFNNGFRLEAGPQLGLLLNSKYKDGDIETDADDDFKTVNASVGVGLNYLSYSGFGGGARYNFGLSDISEDNNTKIKANTLQISLFYMFDNRHKAKSR